MLKNYLTVALRSFRRGRLYAFVNVFGLALGMTTCALIFLLVYHEWSFDRFHTDADEIHRVYFEFEQPDGETGYQAMMTPEFTPAFKEAFPGIEAATRLVRNDLDFETDGEQYRKTAAEIDADFFRIFTWDVFAGDAGAAIEDPSQMVLTAETATSMFGVGPGSWQDAVGEVVTISNGDLTMEFTVGAVMQDFPNNSSISFDIAFSFENYDPIQLGGNNWGGRTSTYVRLADTATEASLEAAFPRYVETEFGEYIESMQGASYIMEGEATDVAALRLQPLTAMHADTDVWLPYEASAHNPMYSWILLGIGTLILLIACINFMTLSVGRSTSRAREVGVRKVLGAYRAQIMKQYWGESFVTAGLALVIGFIGAVALLPWFNTLAGTDLSFGSLSPLFVVFAMLGLILTVGLVAGVYPAMVLSNFRPARVLKGDVSTPRNGLFTRSLIVLQFTISIGLIVSMGIMTQQLGFLLNRDLGFDDEFVLAVDARGISDEESDAVLQRFKDALASYDGVVNLDRAGYTFTRGSDRNTWTNAEGVTRAAYNFGVGYDYLDVMGMEVAEGRNFSEEYPSDPTASVLVNEALVREFGIEDPVGTQLSGWLDWIYEESPTIIGVVKDFHFQSLHQDVQPAVMNMHPDYYNYMGAIMVRLRPDNVSESLTQIEKAWQRILPEKPFTYSFVEADLEQQYAAEQRWQNIVTWSSVLAILIACMGLFGLALLTVSRRTKEIGIRKVLGATVPGVTALLSREFAWMVLVAAILAAPLAWIAMDSWLENFAYRIDIGPGIFVAASLAALVIAVGTVGIHAVRAAQSDPVKSLRVE